MAESTAERLAQRLRDAHLYRLADRAATGEFDDFRTEHAMPKHVLMTALKSESNPTNHRIVSVIMTEVASGEWDSTPEEAEAWAQSEEGQALLRELMEQAT